MPELPEPLPTTPLKPWDRWFLVWIGVGVFLITLALCGGSPRPEGYPTFIIGGEKGRAERARYDAWVTVFGALVCIAFVHGAVGARVFFRQGCVVLLVSGLAIAICGMAWVSATWVDL